MIYTPWQNSLLSAMARKTHLPPSGDGLKTGGSKPLCVNLPPE
jgi:hypothetical protein